MFSRREMLIWWQPLWAGFISALEELSLLPSPVLLQQQQACSVICFHWYNWKEMCYWFLFLFNCQGNCMAPSVKPNVWKIHLKIKKNKGGKEKIKKFWPGTGCSVELWAAFLPWLHPTPVASVDCEIACAFVDGFRFLNYSFKLINYLMQPVFEIFWYNAKI